MCLSGHCQSHREGFDLRLHISGPSHWWFKFLITCWELVALGKVGHLWKNQVAVSMPFKDIAYPENTGSGTWNQAPVDCNCILCQHELFVC